MDFNFTTLVVLGAVGLPLAAMSAGQLWTRFGGRRAAGRLAHARMRSDAADVARVRAAAMEAEARSLVAVERAKREAAGKAAVGRVRDRTRLADRAAVRVEEAISREAADGNSPSDALGPVGMAAAAELRELGRQARETGLLAGGA